MTPKTFIAWVIYNKYILMSVAAVLITIISLIVVHQNQIKAWFESIGPPLEKFFRNPENDWIYLILLVVLLQVYRTYPAFFAPATCLVVMGLMILLCFQYNNFNTEEVVNQWLIVGLFVLPIPPLIAIMVKTKTVFLHWGAIGAYIAMVALIIIINPNQMLGKFVQDNANVYVVALLGLFCMIAVYLNKHFTKALWPNYITQLGFVLLCLLVAAFSFQYAVRFFLQNPNFSANYLLMLAVIIGFVVLFLSFIFKFIRIPSAWRASKLIYYVLFCYIHDFIAGNRPMAFYVLIAEVMLIVWYIVSKKVYRKIEQGDKGKQLFNDPISLRKQANISVPFDFKANYAISFWLYLVPQASEEDASSSLFVNILDYNGKPKVMYNAAQNTLRVTVRLPFKKGSRSDAEVAKAGDDAYDAVLDAGGNETAAEEARKKAERITKYNSLGDEVLMGDISNVPLQRWHHMVLAYNNGVFDIFLNGVLHRSVPGVLTDTLGKTVLIGSDSGNRGKVCNLVFYQGGTSPVNSFTKDGSVITAKKVTDLYNNFVSKNPPIISRVFSIAPEPSMTQIRPNPVMI